MCFDVKFFVLCVATLIILEFSIYKLMRVFLEHCSMIALLCVLFPGMIACTYLTSIGSNKSKDGKIKKEKKDDVYPPPPARIAEAKFKLIDGGYFALEENEGQVTLINLWGIWCAPCIKEMPHLIKMQTKYRDKKFQIVGLNVGDEYGEKEDEENIRNFAKKQRLNYKLGWVDRSILNKFYETAQTEGVPQSFLINRYGKLIGIFVGGGANTIKEMKELVEKTIK